MKKTLFVAATALLFTAAGASAQILLTGYTFETSAPTTAGPFVAENGSEANSATVSAATGVHAGTSTYSSPAGNGSTKSFSSNGWAVGDYYQFTLTTAPTTAELFVTFGAYSSGTGPLNFSLSYSVNGGAFSSTTNNAYTVGPTSFAPAAYQSGDERSFDITGLPANTTAGATSSSIVFRLVDTSTTSANLTTPGTVAATGTSRVDDFNVSTGSYVFPAASVPEPTTYAYVIAGLGGLALVSRRRRSA